MIQGRRNEFLTNAYKYWGKSNTTGYHLLGYHSLDVAAVAWYMLAPETKLGRLLSMQSGLSPELLRFLVVYCLLIHDLGKFSKRFQALNSELFNALFPAEQKKEYEIRHDCMGYLLWRGDGQDVFPGLSAEIAKISPQLVGLLNYFIEAGFGHHGTPPQKSNGNLQLRATKFFDEDDIEAAKQFVLECLGLLSEVPVLLERMKEFLGLCKKIGEVAIKHSNYGVSSGI